MGEPYPSTQSNLGYFWLAINFMIIHIDLCRFSQLCKIKPFDVTEPNFYLALDTAYDILYDRETVTVLDNYGDTENTSLTFTLNPEGSKGNCIIDGVFKDKDMQFRNGISFSFRINQGQIPDMLNRMNKFFSEMIRIQGHNNFI